MGNAVIIYVQDARGGIWTKAFGDAPDVLELAEAEWNADTTGWRHQAGDLQLHEFSRVFDYAGGTLYVCGQGGIIQANLLNAEIDMVISLNDAGANILREVLHAQRERSLLRHHRLPVRDLTPQHCGAQDQANATTAARAALDALLAGQRAVVHCMMGVHRSPALAAAIVRRLSPNLTLHQAHQPVRSCRAVAQWIPETAGAFDQIIQSFQEGTQDAT